MSHVVNPSTVWIVLTVVWNQFLDCLPKFLRFINISFDNIRTMFRLQILIPGVWEFLFSFNNFLVSKFQLFLLFSAYFWHFTLISRFFPHLFCMWPLTPLLFKLLTLFLKDLAISQSEGSLVLCVCFWIPIISIFTQSYKITIDPIRLRILDKLLLKRDMFITCIIKLVFPNIQSIIYIVTKFMTSSQLMFVFCVNKVMVNLFFKE